MKPTYFSYGTKRVGFGDRAIPEADYSMCWNAYIALDGTIRKLPFEAGRAGLWKFDGQVFYL